MKHLHVPLSDEGDSDLSPTFNRCFDFIEDSLTRGGKTFLFCRQAQNRSPTIVIAYLMTRYQKTLMESYSIVQSKKSDIAPHENYFKQLQLLDQELFGQISMTEKERGGNVQEVIRGLRVKPYEE